MKNYGDGAQGQTLRQTAGPARLLLLAIGGPREIWGKVVRIARTARLYVDSKEVERRLERLRRVHGIARMPSRLQMLFGGLDMLRYMITPAARDYYASRGINFNFHVLLRFLDDPVSMTDPVGFLSERDSIIGHMMQVVHLNPIYDTQLLEMFEDGVRQLEEQLERMLDGTHPRARTIGAIVEHPDYHRQLLDFVRRYREDPGTAQLVRVQGDLRAKPEFALAEAQFSALTTFLNYASRLPATFPGLVRHYASNPVINPAYCDRAGFCPD